MLNFSRCDRTVQRDQITSNLNELNTSDSEYKGLIENAFSTFREF